MNTVLEVFHVRLRKDNHFHGELSIVQDDLIEEWNKILVAVGMHPKIHSFGFPAN
jgi:hypothetical protein